MQSVRYPRVVCALHDPYDYFVLVSSILKTYFTALATPFFKFSRPFCTPSRPPGMTSCFWPRKKSSSRPRVKYLQ